MKNIVLFVLLFVLTLGNLGVLLIFKVKQQYIKSEIKKQIKQSVPENELTIIIQTTENKDLFIWKEKNEFLYNGSMYDVVKKDMQKDKIIYSCINDSQETSLFANLDEWVRHNTQNDNATKKTCNNLIQLIMGAYFPPQIVELTLYEESLNHFSFYNFFHPTYTLAINSPPPKG